MIHLLETQVFKTVMVGIEWEDDGKEGSYFRAKATTGHTAHGSITKGEPMAPRSWDIEIYDSVTNEMISEETKYKSSLRDTKGIVEKWLMVWIKLREQEQWEKGPHSGIANQPGSASEEAHRAAPAASA